MTHQAFGVRTPLPGRHQRLASARRRTWLAIVGVATVVVTQLIAVAPTGTADVPVPPVRAAAAAAGTPNSELFGWGFGSRGALGPGTPYETNVTTPTQVATDGPLAGKTITDVQGNVQWSCAVADGQVYCWGNSGSPFGIADRHASADQREPLPVDTRGALAGLSVTNLSLARYNACVVASGAAYCWGTIDVLGTGATVSPRVPTAVNIDGALSGRTVQQISTQDNYACAAADGRAYCWGDNRFGTLGNGSTAASKLPVAVDTSGVLAGKYVTDVGASRYAACALASGQVYCWGAGSFLGAGYEYASDAMNSTHPRPVAVDRTGALAGKTLTALSVSNGTICVLADGQPVCWGYQNGGQVTPSNRAEILEPTPLSKPGPLAGRKATQLVLGDGFGCVLADGLPFCWGNNVRGQLGNGATGYEFSPVPVYTGGALAGRRIVAIAAGPGSAQTFAIAGSPTAPTTPTAAPATPADAAPIGYLDRGILSGAYYNVGGWAVDPNRPNSSVDVQVVDTRPGGTTASFTFHTGGARPDVVAAVPYVHGRTGFDGLIHLKGAGTHTVCLTAKNSGPGADLSYGCQAVTVPPLSGSYVAANNRPGVIAVDGFAADPDNPGRKINLRIDVAGPAGTTSYGGWKTALGRPALLGQLPWAGVNTGFAGTIPVTVEGTYSVCVFGGDISGQSTPLGCQQVSVRNAFGYLDDLTVQPTGNGKFIMRVNGWIIDPNLGAQPGWFRLALDREFPTTGAELTARSPRPDVAAAVPGYGEDHGFNYLTEIEPGVHTVCLQAVSHDGGVGNVTIACRTFTAA